MRQWLGVVVLTLAHPAMVVAQSRDASHAGEPRIHLEEAARLRADRTGLRGTRDVVPGPTGELLVIDGTGRLHYFAADGDHRSVTLGDSSAQTTVIRGGAQGQQWWVAESGTRAVQWLDSRARPVRRELPAILDSAKYATWTPIAIPVPGKAILLATRRDGLQDIIGVGASAPPLHSFSASGQRVRVRTADGLSTIVPVPFARSPLWHVAPSGRYFVVVTDTGRPGTAAIEVRAFGGKKIYRAELAYVPESLTTQELERAIQRELSSRAEKWRPEARRMLDSATRTLPRVKPGVLEVLVGADGSAWTRASTPFGKHLWTVFSPEGQRLGSVTVPSHVALRAIESGAVWATEAGVDGRTDLVRYSVRIAPASVRDR